MYLCCRREAKVQKKQHGRQVLHNKMLGSTDDASPINGRAWRLQPNMLKTFKLSPVIFCRRFPELHITLQTCSAFLRVAALMVSQAVCYPYKLCLPGPWLTTTQWKLLLHKTCVKWSKTNGTKWRRINWWPLMFMRIIKSPSSRQVCIIIWVLVVDGCPMWH